jgi:hypothetical protein
MRSEQEVIANLRAAERGPLSPEELQAVVDIYDDQ